MNHIEEKIIQTIDEHRDEIIAFAKDIQSHPEPGFYEERTACLLYTSYLYFSVKWW